MAFYIDATYPLATLESKLLEYVGSHENAKQFNLSAIPVISKAEEQLEQYRKLIQFYIYWKLPKKNYSL